MKTKSDRKQIVKKINNAAKKYKQNLVGKTFLYVFDNKYIEVIFKAKDFKHLTGVESTLSAQDFYKNANAGKLQANQIYFSARHPYKLANKKIKHLCDISTLAMGESFMLKDITTQTETYKYGTTDLNFALCFNKEIDATGLEKGPCFIAKSLRDEDCFSKSQNAYTITHIYSKYNNQTKYTNEVYYDKQHSIHTLPSEIQKLLSIKLLNKYPKTTSSLNRFTENVHKISNDTICENVDSLLDLYTLSKQKSVSNLAIFNKAHENDMEFGSFNAFKDINNRAKLESAYDKLNNNIENIPFKDVYKHITKFVQPFIDKDYEPLTWSPSKGIWEHQGREFSEGEQKSETLPEPPSGPPPTNTASPPSASNISDKTDFKINMNRFSNSYTNGFLQIHNISEKTDKPTNEYN